MRYILAVTEQMKRTFVLQEDFSYRNMGYCLLMIITDRPRSEERPNTATLPKNTFTGKGLSPALINMVNALAFQICFPE
jgi:hypothetical protein